jgi:hypothetical protein
VADDEWEAIARAAKNEAPYPWHLKLKLALIRFVGWIAQRVSLAVLLLALCALWPATVSADAGHHAITPQVSVVLRGNAPGTVYCPTGCTKMYAYTAKTNTVTILKVEGSGAQFKTAFKPTAGKDYVTRNVYAEARAAGVNPVKAAAYAKGYSSLSAAKSASGLSMGAAGGQELDR